MTGRELIIYILEHHLEDEDIILKPHKETFDRLGLISIEKAAADCGVGLATIKAWCARKYLDFITIDETIYICKNKKYKDVKSWEEI